MKYIVRRIQRRNYRGLHISQHNRHDLDNVVEIIKIMFEVTGGDYFKIPPGDDKGKRLNGYDSYYEIVAKIKRKIEKGTINSIKKNLFPDFEKMGFLHRDKKGRAIKSGKLSETSINLLKGGPTERYRIFTDAIECLFKKEISKLAETLYYSDYKNTPVKLEEFMLILSDNDPEISNKQKTDMLTSFRGLNRRQTSRVLGFIKAYCDPGKFTGNKNDKKDYANWKNQSQQIFTLLKYTVYFDITQNTLRLNTGQYGIFSDSQIKTRTMGAKKDYLKNHEIKKTVTFELHHIIPFSCSRNKEEHKLIDNWKNLVYLNEKKHSEFKNKKMYILRAAEKNLNFYDLDESNKNYIRAENGTSALYAENLSQKMQVYNRNILKELFDHQQTE